MKDVIAGKIHELNFGISQQAMFDYLIAAGNGVFMW